MENIIDSRRSTKPVAIRANNLDNNKLGILIV
jgi:hypothetical protein